MKFEESGTRGAAAWLGGLALCVCSATTIEAQVPSTDIFMVTVEGTEVADPVRLTNRDGYDNQPMFLVDGSGLLYSSRREGATDIYLYDLDAESHRAIALTPESEYSPTPIPGRDAVSVVRDYGELKQQLWAFPLGDGSPELLLPGVNPVGYHAWIDGRRLVLFVLGEPMTLQLATVGPGEGKVVARSPGRVLARIPGSQEMSFVDKTDAQRWWITALDPDTEHRRRLMPTLEQVEDYAWAPDGAVWAGRGTRLYRRTRGDGGEWKPVADLADHGIDEITRLTFSPDGSRLALVARHAAAGDP